MMTHTRRAFWTTVIALCLPNAIVCPTIRAADPAAGAPVVRDRDEDVNSEAVRNRQGLHPSKDMLFNGWGVTPAGKHVECGDMALRIVAAPDKKAIVAVSAGYKFEGVTIIRLGPNGDASVEREHDTIALPEAFNGLAFSRDGKHFLVSGGDTGKIHIFKYADGHATLWKSPSPMAEGPVFLAGLAVHHSTGHVYVCNEAGNEVWQLEPDASKIIKTIPVGEHPYTCSFGGDGRHLYVSNWGSKSVSIIDTETGRRLRDINVGLRPNDMCLAPDGRLFVACSGDNSVYVIQTAQLETPEKGASPARRPPLGTREIISTAADSEAPEGSTPCSVAVSPSGKTLFVANADNNNIMVVNIAAEGKKDKDDDQDDDDKEKASKPKGVDRSDAVTSSPAARIEGFIPTGWYPSAVGVTPMGDFLLVASGKGLTSRANVPKRGAKPAGPKLIALGVPFDHPGMTFEGSISFIKKPTAQQMAEYTTQVRRNSPYTASQMHVAALPSDCVIPASVGEKCPIKHVLYIIKENRTYDQVFGDMKDAQGKPLGNGDPKLTLFGEDVTPNHHKLARDYVLLDNLYCNSEVSVDGHSWCDGAIATDYIQRSWILSYSKHGVLPGNTEMATPANGFIWNHCRRNGVTFKTYGEGADGVPTANRGVWGKGRDMDLVKHWIDDLHTAETSGNLPQFAIMSLGEDHTRGTTPGSFTPQACVGSNDVALGRIVEAASHSKFWNEMAIFAIEDDPQNGPDHVDCHRTVGLVISPWCRQGVVDSRLYTTTSMVRTIELILGLPPMTQYDAAATPMFGCFQKSAQAVPYTTVMPRIDLAKKNTIGSPFAIESSKLDFSDYDRVPDDVLNRIVWAAVKGTESPCPPPVHRAVFAEAVAK